MQLRVSSTRADECAAVGRIVNLEHELAGQHAAQWMERLRASVLGAFNAWTATTAQITFEATTSRTDLIQPSHGLQRVVVDEGQLGNPLGAHQVNPRVGIGALKKKKTNENESHTSKTA